MRTIQALAFLAALITSPAFAADAAPEADRKAILGMAGKFKVHFHFAETASFKPGYALQKPYDEDAHEWVVVAEDTGRRIALQHLLVVPGGVVVHHWRQIWTFEDRRVNEIQGENTWKTRELTEGEARGTWTQLVTQVDNSPRYEGVGKWNHEGGASRWVSGDTWRPLPRREHTKRKDYKVVGGINTHLLTQAGWSHEQANIKLDLTPEGPKALAREEGLNTYTRDESFDFSPAEKFWADYKDFSNTLVAAWDEVTARESAYRLEDDIQVSNLRDDIKDLGKEKLPAAEAKQKALAVIQKYLRKPGVAEAKGK
jgi:hypothetical protein